jgi:hypothetical protein
MVATDVYWWLLEATDDLWLLMVAMTHKITSKEVISAISV